jgi:outer membrane protein insertion porin family
VNRRVQIQNKLASLICGTACLIALHLNSSHAQEEIRGRSFHISRIEIDGNRRIDEAAIRMQLQSKPGAVTEETVSRDVKELYKIGYFDQVTVGYRAGPPSVLHFVVVEKPVVRKVFVRGNDKVKESELASIFSFGTLRFLDKKKLKDLQRSGELYYQTRGYYDAQVDYSIVPAEGNQVDVTFKIQEGEKYQIDEIVFRGLSDIDEGDLIEVMETRPYKWWNSWLLGTGRVNEELLKQDRNKMRQYFIDNGYLDATISEAVVEKVDEDLVVYFDVFEGDQYTVKAIAASGDLVDKSVDATLEDTDLEEGDIFNASTVREDSFKISDKFGDQGYAYANVIPDTRINRESRSVNLTYKIDKGKKVRINKIRIQGNDKTYDNVIRRELTLNERDLYSSSKIRRSETLLQRLGYFDEVSVASQPATRDDEVDLAVNVKEGSTGSFTVGAGYSSFDGVLFNTRVSENNLFGTGRRVDLNVDVGDFRNDVILSFLDPRVADTRLSLGVSGIHTRRDFFDFDRQQTGGGMSFGYPLDVVFGEVAQDMSGQLRYELLRNEILNVDAASAAPLVIASEGESTSSAFIPQVTRNTIDNPLNPTKGSRQIVSVEVAGAGGDQEYYLLEASNRWYYPLADTSIGRFVFSWRTSLGYGDSFNDEPFPLFKRFFPGGINSVRGFRNRSLGPKDENGNEYGGSKELVNNLELIFPLVESAGLKGVVFYDVGEAFDDEESITFAGLRQAYGGGFRWLSPLGPIRIEVGIPLDRETGEKGFQTQFSFGAPL